MTHRNSAEKAAQLEAENERLKARSLAERAAARRGEEDRRKRDAGELLRLRGRVKELESENVVLRTLLGKASVRAGAGQAIEPTKGEP